MKSLTLAVDAVDRSPRRTLGEWVMAVDCALLRSVRALERPSVTACMRAFTRLGDAHSWILLALLLLCSGNEAAFHGQLLGLGATLGLIFSQILKRTCRRTRPSLGIGGFTALMDNPDDFSFPSGHTSVAFAVALSLADQGSALGPLMGCVACLVATSRIYLGAHYPLDVAAGAVLGGTAGLCTRALLL